MNKVFALKFKLDSERILSKPTTPLGSPKNNAKKRF